MRIPVAVCAIWASASADSRLYAETKGGPEMPVGV